MERQVLGSHPFMETKKESQPEVEQWLLEVGKGTGMWVGKE